MQVWEENIEIEHGHVEKISIAELESSNELEGIQITHLAKHLVRYSRFSECHSLYFSEVFPFGWGSGTTKTKSCFELQHIKNDATRN